MVHYNIIHTEDDERDCARPVNSYAGREGLTYLNVDSLGSLERNLLQNNSADVWVVDGRFAVEKGKAIELLAPRAVEFIRVKHPDAKIVLYSNEDKLPEVAAQCGVEFFIKREVSAKDLVSNLKKMINASQ